MLEVKDLTVYYESALALNKVSLRVENGEFVAVVGPNGAGKTTLLRAISGVLEAERRSELKTWHRGTITFNGKRIDKLKPHIMVRRGIIHCPERRRPFPEMTVIENLMMGAYLRKNKGEIAKDLERNYELFPVLKKREKQLAGTLSGGEQQMLAIARALMSKPQLLLIDEPSLGLAPILRKNVFDRIKDIQRTGVTILLVEQDVSMCLALADRLYVIAHGMMAAEGTREDLMKDRDVREIYLGL